MFKAIFSQFNVFERMIGIVYIIFNFTHNAILLEE